MKTKLFGTDARHATFKQDLDKLLKTKTEIQRKIGYDHAMAS